MEAYHRALKNYDSVLEQLSRRLNKKEYVLVLKLKEQATIVRNKKAYSDFLYGFSAGMVLMGEVRKLAEGEKAVKIV